MKRYLLILAALLIGCIVGWFGRGLDAPQTLVNAGVKAAFAENDRLLGEIERYEAEGKQYEADLAESRQREAEHKAQADEAIERADQAHAARLAMAEDKAETARRESEVRDDLEAARKSLTAIPPPSCRPLYDQLARLTDDVEWEIEQRMAKGAELDLADQEIAELRSAQNFRAMELSDVQEQLSQVSGRLDSANEVIRKAKRNSKKVKIAGVAMIAAGVFLAVKQ